MPVLSKAERKPPFGRGDGGGGATGRAKRLGGSGASPDSQESQDVSHASTGRGEAGGLRRSPDGPAKVSMLRRISMGSLRLVALPPLP